MIAVAWVLGIGIGLFLLVRFPRQMAIVVLVLVALVAGAVLIWWVVSSSADADKKRIIATVELAPDKCKDPAYPLYVILRNGGTRTVQSLSFEIVARRPGFSSKVVDDFWDYDKIIAPNEGWGTCWTDHKYSFDYPAPGLEWSITVTSVNFG